MDTGMVMVNHRGSLHSRSKLSEEQVRRIRIMLADGSLQKDVAKYFSLDPSTVSDIKRRKIWGWLDCNV